MLFVPNNTCIFCYEMMEGCDTCNHTACFSCNSSYTFINDSYCSPICDSDRCEICDLSNTSLCYGCFDNYYLLENDFCRDPCGDVKVGLEACDDGGNLDHDGCDA
jgi:hypothetical protein